VASNWEDTIDKDVANYFQQARADNTNDAMLSNISLARPLVLKYKSKAFIGAQWDTILALKKFRSSPFFTLNQVVELFYIRAQQFHSLSMTYGASILELQDELDIPFIAAIRPQEMVEAGPIGLHHLINSIGNPKAEDAAVLAAWEFANIEFNMSGYNPRVRQAYQEMFMQWNEFLLKQYQRDNIGTSLKLMLGYTLLKKGVYGYYTWELVKKHLIHQTQLVGMEGLLKSKGLNSEEIGKAVFAEATIPGCTGLFQDSEFGRILTGHNKAMPGLLGYISIDIISNGLEHQGQRDFHKMTSCLDYSDPNY
jgi:hypothetical protein